MCNDALNKTNSCCDTHSLAAYLQKVFPCFVDRGVPVDVTVLDQDLPGKLARSDSISGAREAHQESVRLDVIP